MLVPNAGTRYTVGRLRIVARSTLSVFWKKHPPAAGPLKAWFAEAKKASWGSTDDIKKAYASASIINSERVVFNIGGNKYRLVVAIWWRGQVVWVKFVGTHAEYDKIDVSKV